MGCASQAESTAVLWFGGLRLKSLRVQTLRDATCTAGGTKLSDFGRTKFHVNFKIKLIDEHSRGSRVDGVLAESGVLGTQRASGRAQLARGDLDRFVTGGPCGEIP